MTRNGAETLAAGLVGVVARPVLPVQQHALNAVGALKLANLPELV